MKKITLIDHYDSFTANVIDWLVAGRNDIQVIVTQFDRLEAEPEELTPLVISPGPKSPDCIENTLNFVRSRINMVPILGVCLGFQALFKIAHGEVGHSEGPCHGWCKDVSLSPESALNLPEREYRVASYHSLAGKGQAKLDTGWKITGSSREGEPQILEYGMNSLCPVIGVQFHPESFLTESEMSLCLRDFFRYRVDQWYRHQTDAIDPLLIPSKHATSTIPLT